MTDWRALLREFLIAGSTVGRKQSEVLMRLQNFATSDEIVAYLEALRAEEKVQHFVAPSGARGGRPMNIWRATTKLVEDV